MNEIAGDANNHTDNKSISFFHVKKDSPAIREHKEKITESFIKIKKKSGISFKVSEKLVIPGGESVTCSTL